MSKKNLVIVGVLVLLLALGAYLKMKKSSPSPLTSQTTNEVVKESTEWANAIKSGKPTSCVMVKGEDKMEYYLEGQKMRADITTTVEAKTQLSHMINDGTYLYIWSDGQAQGSKTTIPTEEDVKQMTEDAKKYETQSQNTPDFTSETGYDNLQNEGYTINCQAVASNSSLLVPPITITFIDPTEMMKKIAPTDGVTGIDMKKLEEMAKQYQDQ